MKGASDPPPIGSVENTLKLRLELIDPVGGRVLWTDEVYQSYAITEGAYYNFGQDFGYPQMFRDGMKSAEASLETFVASQPPSFWEQLEHSPRSARTGAAHE
jgi:hypothetical protein